MKTFSEFIAEAEVKWNTGTLSGSKKSPSDTAGQKLAQLGRQISNPRNTPQQTANLSVRAKKMKSAITGASEVAKVSDPRPETVATQMGREGRVSSNNKIRGYASKKDPISSVGSLSGVSRQRITDVRTGRDLGSASVPGENVHGRNADTRGRSQGGATTPQRNVGQGRSTPERGKYSGG